MTMVNGMKVVKLDTVSTRQKNCLSVTGLDFHRLNVTLSEIRSLFLDF